jgi:hypothetical protein
MKKSMWAFVVLGAFPMRAQQAPEVQLGLKAGNYWVYVGQVAWSDVTAKNSYDGKKISWKTEILESTTRGELKAYLIRSSVTDLAWYQPEERPGLQSLWIVYQNRFYILGADENLLRRFHDPNDSLISVVVKEEPVVQFPLRLNRCTTELQPEEPRNRDDLWYCWHMETKRVKRLRSAGVPQSPVVQWTAWYRTNPDHQILGFVPEVGIVSYDFSHHGSISEAHVKLAAAHVQ